MLSNNSLQEQPANKRCRLLIFFIDSQNTRNINRKEDTLIYWWPNETNLHDERREKRAKMYRYSSLPPPVLPLQYTWFRQRLQRPLGVWVSCRSNSQGGFREEIQLWTHCEKWMEVVSALKSSFHLENKVYLDFAALTCRVHVPLWLDRERGVTPFSSSGWWSIFFLIESEDRLFNS